MKRKKIKKYLVGLRIIEGFDEFEISAFNKTDARKKALKAIEKECLDIDYTIDTIEELR